MSFDTIIIPGTKIENGNCDTAKHLQNILGIKNLRFASELEVKNNLEDELTPNTNILVLHAFKCSKIIKKIRQVHQQNVKIILIFGGTDVNNLPNFEVSSDYAKDVLSSINLANNIVSFTESMINLVYNYYTSKGVQNFKRKTKHKFKIIRSGYQTVPQKISHLGDENSKTLVMVANFRPVKNIIRAINIWTIFYGMTQKSQNFTFKIIGKPTTDDKEYSNQILDKIQNNSVPSIQIINDADHSKVIEELKNSYAVINTSISEGMSQALIHAMSFGKPVLCSNIAANSELLRLQNNVTNNDCYDSQEFGIFSDDGISDNRLINAQLLFRVFTDPAFYEKLSNRSIEVVKKWNDPEIEAKKYRELI